MPFLTLFRQWRRRRLLARPIPAHWPELIARNFGLFNLLSEADQTKLLKVMRVFAAERHWEGCAGMEVGEEVRLAIASQACLLLLGIPDHDYFSQVRSILVYPQAYLLPQHRHEGAVVHEEPVPAAGTAVFNGPVLLSWEDVVRGGRNARDGRNVVLHEFAHFLDMEEGLVNGTPPLGSRKELEMWQSVMTEEYHRLRQASEAGLATLLNRYGKMDPGEFFAVATECFFEQPGRMQRSHPRLYEVLKGYFGQDPAGWPGRQTSSW